MTLVPKFAEVVPGAVELQDSRRQEVMFHHIVTGQHFLFFLVHNFYFI